MWVVTTVNELVGYLDGEDHDHKRDMSQVYNDDKARDYHHRQPCSHFQRPVFALLQATDSQKTQDAQPWSGGVANSQRTHRDDVATCESLHTTYRLSQHPGGGCALRIVSNMSHFSNSREAESL